jgi:hypothetical protein
MKPTTLQLGTIIHGTMRVEDTMPALLSTLDGIRLTGPDKEYCDDVQQSMDEWIEADDKATDSDNPADADDLMLAAHIAHLEMEMNETLLPLAESYAPDYCYVGSHPGDGSDLGVWPCEELFDDTTQGSFDGYCWRLGENNHPGEETIPADMTHALAVNDHGNATLFARASRGLGWIECWSIV